MSESSVNSPLNESIDSNLIYHIDNDLEFLEKKIITIENRIINLENKLNTVFIICMIYGFSKILDIF